MFSATGTGARRGLIHVQSGEIATPTFLVATTRGAVPHITPDYEPEVPVAAVFAEDFWDHTGAVHVPLPLPLNSRCTLGLATNPIKPIPRKAVASEEKLTLTTYQGPLRGDVHEIADLLSHWNLDAVVVPWDIPPHEPTPRRIANMRHRELVWAAQFRESRQNAGGHWPLLASVPRGLADDSQFIADVGGDPQTADYGPVPNPYHFHIDSEPPTTIVDMLAKVAAGADLVWAPATRYSDAGCMISATWDCSSEQECEDLHDVKYKTDMSQIGVTGYARAYIHHLLEAREMTAFVVLQRHNLAMLEQLFVDVRASIDAGTFAADLEEFQRIYGDRKRSIDAIDD